LGTSEQKDINNLEVSKFMYKYTNSQLPTTFVNYFKLITDVHPYNTKEIKTRQLALPKARSNLGVKMIRDRPIFLGADLSDCRPLTDRQPITDISKIFKSCFRFHHQKYDVFYALPFFQKLYKSGFMS